MTDKPHPVLRETAVDRAQTSLRTLTSLIDVAAPGVGSIFGELISVILPANREQRMALFASKLDIRIKALGVELENTFRNLGAEQLALLEDGLRASARATQEERVASIADIVAVGLQKPDAAARQREVLDMLSSLSDYDVTYLSKYANWRGTYVDRRWMTVGDHRKLSDAQREELELEDRFEELARQKLLSQGLLVLKLELKPRFGQEDQLEVKDGDSHLTKLGEFFCLSVGLWPDGERPLLG